MIHVSHGGDTPHVESSVPVAERTEHAFGQLFDQVSLMLAKHLPSDPVLTEYFNELRIDRHGAPPLRVRVDLTITSWEATRDVE